MRGLTQKHTDRKNKKTALLRYELLCFIQVKLPVHNYTRIVARNLYIAHRETTKEYVCINSSLEQ